MRRAPPPIPPRRSEPVALQERQKRVESGAFSIRVGRYEIADRIASGGMATVHLGRLLGAGGFARLVAVKRLLPQFAADPDFERMFVEEARLAARIRHPNVVSTIDAVASEGELLLVMDYVHGESLWRLMSAVHEQGEQVPLPVVSAILVDVLHGLHAAHEATDRHGRPLGVVHRDVSPQNVIVGEEGVARVLDFGIAKAVDTVQHTHTGLIRGKAAYMAPEQLFSTRVSRGTDLYAVGLMLWELWVGTRLYPRGERPELLSREPMPVEAPSRRSPRVTARMDAVLARATHPNPDERFQSGLTMASAIEALGPIASRATVAEWVQSVAGKVMRERAALAAAVESAGASIRPEADAEPLEDVPLDLRFPAPPTGELLLVQSKPEMNNAEVVASPALVERRAAEVRPRRAWVWVAAGALAVVLAAGALLAMNQVEDPVPLAAAAEPAPSQGASSDPTRAEVAAKEAVPKEGPPTEASTSERDVPSAGAESAEPPKAVPTPRVSRAPQPRPPRAKPTKSKASCDPPYTIDAAGRRHFKAECF